MQWLQPLQNRQFGSKIKMFKNMRKTSLAPQQICSIQKRTPRNTDIRKMTSFRKWAKYGHHANTIALAKSSISFKS